MDIELLRESLAEELGISPGYLLTIDECAERFRVRPTTVSARASYGALVRYIRDQRAFFYVCPEMTHSLNRKELAKLSEAAPRVPVAKSREALEVDIFHLTRDLRVAEERIDELEKLCTRHRVFELEAKARRAELLEESVRDLEARLETESARRLLAERQMESLSRELKRERLEQARLIAEQDFTIERLEEQLQRERWEETRTVYGAEALGVSSCDDEHQGGAVAAEAYLSEVGRRSLVSRARKKVNKLVAVIGRE